MYREIDMLLLTNVSHYLKKYIILTISTSAIYAEIYKSVYRYTHIQKVILINIDIHILCPLFF